MGISENNEISSNLLQCPRDNNEKISFTLMDYLNNLFTSKDPKDVLRFYNYFENRDQLIKWMMKRPKGNYRIAEFNKDENDIIVVIPTMDVNGKFAKTSREEIFKGMHIIFVESGIGNYYFNYAHNCNAGIKKAMEYNPKWIILSNDDMYKIDDVEVLIKELNKIKNTEININFPKKAITTGFGKLNLLGKIIFKIFLKDEIKTIKKFENLNKIYFSYCISGCDFIHNLLRFLHTRKFTYLTFGSFMILSNKFINRNNNTLFDENFINAAEDVDLALKIFLTGNKTNIINYDIGSINGGSFGLDKNRRLRDLAGQIYLNYKISLSLK